MNETLERVPGRLSRALRRIRNAAPKKVRLALGVALVGLGLAGPLLPVAGVWMIPVGLWLIAEDRPRIHKPAAKLQFWMGQQWLKLRSWWQGRFQPA